MDKYQSSWSSDIHNDNIMEGSTNSEHASNSSKTATDDTIEDFIPLESFESLKSGQRNPSRFKLGWICHYK